MSDVMLLRSEMECLLYLAAVVQSLQENGYDPYTHLGSLDGPGGVDKHMVGLNSVEEQLLRDTLLAAGRFFDAVDGFVNMLKTDSENK